MGFLRGFSIAMGANIIVFVLSFLNNKLIYLYLPEADNGVFFLVLRAAMFVPLFFGDWFRLSCMNIAGADRSKISSLSANGFWLSTGLGFVLVVISLLWTLYSDSKFLGIPGCYLPAVFIAGAAFIARNIWQSLLLIEHRMVSYGLSFIVWAALFLVLDVIFIAILGYGLFFVILTLVIATLFTALWTFVSSYRAVGHAWRPSLDVFSLSAKIGARAWIAVIGMFLFGNIHAFSIEPLAGPVQGLVMVALFSIGLRIQNLFTRASDVAGAILYSHVVQQDEASGARMSMMVTRNIILVSIIFAFFAIVFVKPLIVLISSSRYIDAALSVVILIPGIIAMNAGSVLNTYYWGRDYPFDIVVAPYVATGAGALMNVVMIPRWGVEGASFSFTTMSIGWFAFVVIRFSKDTKLTVTDIIIPKMSDVSWLFQRIWAKYSSNKGDKTGGETLA